MVDRFIAAADSIRNHFQLSLFGFDVIVPSNPRPSGILSGRVTDPASCSTACMAGADVLSGEEDSLELELVVIDVNFFPSYKEVTDFPVRLRKFLRSKMQ